MNERYRGDPEKLPLTPQDYAMKIRGFFDDRVGDPDFDMWRTALHDILEVRRLEERKQEAFERVKKTGTKQDRIESVKASLRWQWKMEENRDKGVSNVYKPAFMELTLDTMRMELAYQRAGEKNSSEATNRELKQLENYVDKIAKQE